MKSHYVNGIYRGRSKILLWIVTLCLVGLVIRVAYIQIVRGPYLEELADELHYRQRTLESIRGEIVDRNGEVLAASGSIGRVSVVHNQIENEEETARVLADVLELEYEDVLKKVQARGKNLHISIPPHEVKNALENLSSKGLYIQTWTRTEEEAKELIKLCERESRYY